nr:hypothetical protein Iba_chr05bCG2590 [Ipomoea batatas]
MDGYFLYYKEVKEPLLIILIDFGLDIGFRETIVNLSSGASDLISVLVVPLSLWHWCWAWQDTLTFIPRLLLIGGMVLTSVKNTFFDLMLAEIGLCNIRRKSLFFLG